MVTFMKVKNMLYIYESSAICNMINTEYALKHVILHKMHIILYKYKGKIKICMIHKSRGYSVNLNIYIQNLMQAL